MVLQGNVLSSGSRFNTQMKFVLQNVAAKTSPSLFYINLYFEMEDRIFVIDSQDFKQGVNISVDTAVKGTLSDF